jgi:plasmid stabilization system protein ParE
MPERGSPCNFKHPQAAKSSAHRSARISAHLVFYEYLREQRLVCIVHVIHGARDVEGLLAGFLAIRARRP